MTDAAYTPPLHDKQTPVKSNNLHLPHLQLIRQFDDCPEIFALIFLNDHTRLNQHLLEHPTEIELSFRLKTPLLEAITQDSLKCFEILMKNGADMDAYNSNNETALVIAARLNRRKMTETLITKGANILQTDRTGRTITEAIIARDDVMLLHAIQLSGRNLLDHDLVNNDFPLTLAINHKARHCIRFILSLEPKIQSFLIFREFSCPITAAICNNDHLSLLQITRLHDFSRIVNMPINVSNFYLHLAVKKGHPKLVRILLENGALTNVRDHNGNTPVHSARDLNSLRALLSYRADLTARNNDGETPREYAAARKNITTFYLLKRMETEKEAYKANLRSHIQEKMRSHASRGQATPDGMEIQPHEYLNFQETEELQEGMLTLGSKPSVSPRTRSYSEHPSTLSPTAASFISVKKYLQTLKSQLTPVNKACDTENDYKRKFIYREWRDPNHVIQNGYTRLDKYLDGNKSKPGEDEDRETFFYCFWLDKQRFLQQSYVQPQKYFPYITANSTSIQEMELPGGAEEQPSTSYLVDELPGLKVWQILTLMKATRDPHSPFTAGTTFSQTH